MQSVAYILEDNKQSQAQPSPHFDVTLSVVCYGSQANKRRCLPQIVGRGRYSDKAGAGGTPFPLCVKDEEGNCRPLLVSIVYASAGWWELAGKLPRAEICSADAFSRRKKCTLSRWWFLKELSLRRKKKKKGFLSEEGP